MNKKISVIVPIYNAEKYLRQTLDSILCQSYTNLEIVCVLDCPTDGSAAMAEEISQRDSRIKIVYHTKNMGLPGARNSGAENAAGEYIHFMDADDLISPNFYETMIESAAREDADVAACSVLYEKKPWRSIWFRKNEAVTGADKMNKTEVTVMGWAWRYLIRKSFWDDRKFLFPDLVPMEDMPVIIPMVYYANKAVLCPDAVYFYKERGDSILNRSYDPEREKQRSLNRKKARRIFREFMRENKIKRPSRLLYYLRKRFG